MKPFVTKIRDLSKKAAEFKAAIQQVPPKVAEVREAVAATRGQLQQLKAQIQSSVADLKAENEDRLGEALQELKGSEALFASAGFALAGVELEISPMQRLILRLRRIEDVPSSTLRELMSANQPRRTLHALLAAMLQAKQMAEGVNLGELEYQELVVSVGPIPSVRLGWRPEESPASVEANPPPLPSAAEAGTKNVAASFFGEGSFFSKPATPAPATVSPEAVTEELPIAAEAEPRTFARPEVSTTAVASSGAEEPERDPLARFKKMPDLSKYRK